MRRLFSLLVLFVPLALQAVDDSEKKVSEHWKRDRFAPLQGGVRVKVLPNPADCETGGEIQFTAVVTDDAGNEVSDAKLKWSVKPKKLGRINRDGLFKASNREAKGIVRVIAQTDQGKAVGHALIRVTGGTPGERIKVKVIPGRAFVKPGETQQFTARIFGPDGEITDAVLTWKVVPANMGSITQDGLFTAGEDIGRCRIVVKAKTNQGVGIGKAIVIVGSAENYIRVKIYPKPAILKRGGMLQFGYEILDEDNAPDQNVKVKWDVFPKSLGTITQDGLFTASDRRGKGFVRVIVKVDNKIGADRSPTLVGFKPEKFRVKVYPKFANVEPGESFEFNAEVFDKDGNAVDIPLKWIVKPKRAGTITPEGLFTAGDKCGKCQVIAVVPPRFGFGRDKAGVLIGRPLIVKIEPKRALVAPKKTKQFNATVTDRDGDAVDVSVIWKCWPSELGTIDRNGLFTASSKPGIGRVVAVVPPEVGFGRDAAEVVVPGYRVIVEPPYPTVSVGGTIQFTADVRDANENSVDIPVIWKVGICSEGASGTITRNGLFTAGDVPGKCRVVALIPRDLGGGIGRTVVTITQ